MKSINLNEHNAEIVKITTFSNCMLLIVYVCFVRVSVDKHHNNTKHNKDDNIHGKYHTHHSITTAPMFANNAVEVFGSFLIFTKIRLIQS